MTLRAKAAEVLGVDADAPASAARAAFLKRVVAEGFAPPAECVWAAMACGESHLLKDADVRAEAAAVHRAAVDDFAKQYWTLPPAERTERWRALGAGSHARLGFELGLGVEVKTHDNPLVEELAGIIRTLYVLPPREASFKQCEWLLANADRRSDFQDASRRLRADEPQLSRLVPSLLIDLARREPFGPVEGIDRDVAEAERQTIATRRMKEAEAAVQRQYESSVPQSYAGGGGSGCGGWPVYFVIALVLFASRACVSNSTRSTTPTFYNDFKQYAPAPPATPKPTFTEIEVKGFMDYEIIGRFNPMPPRYNAWNKAGRPGDTTLPGLPENRP